MVRDSPSWQLPPGATYDQLNMLNDTPGVARQRGGTTALFSGAQTAFCTSLGWVYSQDVTPIEQLYGFNGKDAKIYAINSSTGVATNIATGGLSGSAIAGRGVRHFGFLAFPYSNSTAAWRYTEMVAGQTSTTTFTNTATASIASANPQVTLSGADTTTNVKVGAIVAMSDGGTSWEYFGRVVSVDSGTKFSVWPVPTRTNGSLFAGQVSTSPHNSNNGGACGASFQNRLLYGNTGSNATVPNDRRVVYSPLVTEEVAPAGSAITVIGAAFVDPSTWPKLNYFDIPGSDPLVALEPIDDNRLLILTAHDVQIFSGNLVTELATTSPTITWDIYPFEVTSGCLSDLSVMRTPAGIMWAGAEGIFAYWPPIRRSLAHTGMRNLLDGKMQNYWYSLVNGANFAIHGAAYARNHYVISGSSNGATWSLACNLNSNAWTRLSGAGTDIFNGVRRPSIPQQTFVARWWDQTGAAPSMTNGQVVRLDPIVAPYAAGSTRTDADGSAVPISLTTRTITGDAETQKLFQRATVRYQQSSTTAAVTVTAQSKLDAADIDASSVRAIGSLSNTNTLTVSSATNATPITITTTTNHGLQSDDFVDIDSVGGLTNANGRWRIAVATSAAFTLVGSIGNAAYTSGGKVKKLTESDFTISSLNSGQGASFTVAGSPNNFEMQAVEIAVLEREPVMSA